MYAVLWFMAFFVTDITPMMEMEYDFVSGNAPQAQQYGFENDSVMLKCPEYSRPIYRVGSYTWYSGQYGCYDTKNDTVDRLAYFNEFYQSGASNEVYYYGSWGEDRATMSRHLDTTWADATINQLQLTDQQWFTCYFSDQYTNIRTSHYYYTGQVYLTVNGK